MTSLAVALAGCASKPGDPVGTGNDGKDKAVVATLGCVLGGAGGALLAKALAGAEARRLNLSPDQTRQRERSYMVGLALVGCAGGGVLAGTAYAKLSESGKKAREQELLEAARSAQVRTYRDPENPTLIGTVTPQRSYAQGSQECRVVEDVLADAGKGEPVLVKFCRNPPANDWAQTTA